MVIDVIIILLLVFSAYFGYKKGLVGILVSFVSLLLAIILGLILQGPIANYLYEDTTIGKTIEDNVMHFVEENLLKEESQGNDEKTNVITQWLTNDTQENFSTQQIVKQITLLILRGVSFIGVIILVYIICFILQGLLNFVFDLPILNSLNKVGGVGINVLHMLLKIWIVLAIAYFISPIPNLNQISNVLSSGKVSKILYENNLLVTMIQSNMK